MSYLLLLLAALGGLLGTYFKGFREHDDGSKVTGKWGMHVPTTAGAIALLVVITATALSVNKECGEQHAKVADTAERQHDREDRIQAERKLAELQEQLNRAHGADPIP
jgi:hypothetical protein